MPPHQKMIAPVRMTATPVAARAHRTVSGPVCGSLPGGVSRGAATPAFLQFALAAALWICRFAHRTVIRVRRSSRSFTATVRVVPGPILPGTAAVSSFFSMEKSSVCVPVLRTLTFTVRSGQDTDPTVAVTGRAGAPVGVRVGVGVGVRVGLPEADGEPPVGLGLAEVDAAPEVGDAEPSDLNRAGIAISAPITMNTAAMTTLGNCIAVLPARTKRVADDPRSFLTQDLVVPISPSIGMRNRLTSERACRRRSGQRIMGPMEDGIRVGLLLVATPQLEDPNFRRSVVLLVEHDGDGGTLGVVLNRPTEILVDRVLPPWAELVTGPAVVFQGGPVALENALALARLPGEDEPLGWRALDGGTEVARVGLVDLEAPPGLLAAELLQLRVFAGYAGWSPGQLRSEVEDGSWYLVPAEAGDVFAGDPERLWQDVLRRQGGDLAFVATFPEDPTLN
ncbi:Putative transcriptional regulator, AlgH/UPF0301 family [Actinomadura mexicana]|uniref:UPF0301 protein SAMN06265355_101695 n=2 Tax=Actinomadura mexicana TaxID=134959 RepID=A0A238V059_9ACTN|nr:Putative transcriptional regulator, AlgH/UPF0301 family [Actinomadura mexicana]